MVQLPLARKAHAQGESRLRERAMERHQFHEIMVLPRTAANGDSGLSSCDHLKLPLECMGFEVQAGEALLSGCASLNQKDTAWRRSRWV